MANIHASVFFLSLTCSIPAVRVPTEVNAFHALQHNQICELFSRFLISKAI